MLPPLDVQAWRLALGEAPRRFVIDDEVFEVVAPWRSLLDVLPPADWHMGLLLGMVHPGDLDRLFDRLDDDDDALTVALVERVVERLVEQVTGRRWWVARRLYGSLAAEWSAYDGALTLAGVDLPGLLETPVRVCDVVYAHLTAGADPQKVAAFDARLSKPPADLDVKASPLVTPEQAGAAFLTAMGGTPGGRVRAVAPREPAAPTGAPVGAPVGARVGR